MDIRHKADGTPYVRPYLGKSADGRPRRPYKEFPGMGDEEARRAAAAWLEGLEDAGRLTLGDALDTYVCNMEAAGRSANTVRTYRMFSTRYASDLRDVPVSDVTAAMLDDLLHKLLIEGARGGEPLSRATVQTFRAFLQGAGRHMAAQGVVESNVARDTMRIRRARVEAMALCGEDVTKLLGSLRRDLDESKDTRRRSIAMAVLLALGTGARVGEVAALRRRDVSTARLDLTIGGTVVEVGGKATRQDTTKGKRTRHVAMDEATARTLREYLRRQRADLGEVSRETPVCTVDGEYMRPAALSHGYAAYRDALGLEKGTTFHCLRHTHATMLLQDGTDARVVQERLGHADVSTTLSIYGHVMPGRDQAAAQRFAGLLEEISD